ncbi:MAG: MFS transporter, partial [Nitrososphaeraceae archaeon]
GVFTSMSAAGSVIGVVLGASIIENFGWRSTFFSIIPITIVLLIVIRHFIYEDQKLSSTDNSKKVSAIENYSNKLKNDNNDNDNDIQSRSIDIKGAITLAYTITSFLLALTYSDENSVANSMVTVSLVIMGTISLMLFVIIERKSKFPLVDLQLITNRIIFSANIILVLIFIIKFAVFQTIPVLVKSPEPLGFGGGITDIADIQLPFMIVFLLFAPSSGIIISRLGSTRPTIFGSIITVIGCCGLFLFHSTGYLVSVNLAIIAAGISLLQVGSMNIILESTPSQFSGISLGMTVIFKMVGSSIGPVIAGMYMEANQTIVGGVNGSLPSPNSYALIFLTLSLTSIISVALSTIINRRVAITSPNAKETIF